MLSFLACGCPASHQLLPPRSFLVLLPSSVSSFFVAWLHVSTEADHITCLLTPNLPGNDSSWREISCGFLSHLACGKGWVIYMRYLLPQSPCVLHPEGDFNCPTFSALTNNFWSSVLLCVLGTLLTLVPQHWSSWSIVTVLSLSLYPLTQCLLL